jgi:hypothetical protein
MVKIFGWLIFVAVALVASVNALYAQLTAGMVSLS